MLFFDRPGNRDSVERVAKALEVPFVGIWLQGDHIAARTTSVSDATLEVLDMREAKNVGRVQWRHIDARKPVEATIELICFDIEAELAHNSASIGYARTAKSKARFSRYCGAALSDRRVT